MNKIDTSKLSPIIKKHAGKAGSLISILQETQGVFGYIPVEAIEYISKHTGLAIAKIEGVASFYSQFRTQPIGKYHILFCLGTACHVNKGKEIFGMLENFLGIKDGETTNDGLFTLSGVACIGCCSLAPAMMIGDKVYGGLTSEKAIEIVRGLKNGE